jgi:hypothetical protein
MLTLLVIAIINIARALKEHKSNSRILGVTVNVLGVALLLAALILGIVQ